jgi:hypothetical protein
MGLPAYDATTWAGRHRIAPEKTADGLLTLLLQGDVHAKDRELILRTGKGGRAAELRKALQLILHCPEYQLA